MRLKQLGRRIATENVSRFFDRLKADGPYGNVHRRGFRRLGPVSQACWERRIVQVEDKRLCPRILLISFFYFFSLVLVIIFSKTRKNTAHVFPSAITNVHSN